MTCLAVSFRLRDVTHSVFRGEPTRHADSPPPHSPALNLPPTNLPPTHHRLRARTMAAPPPPPASHLNTLTPIVPRATLASPVAAHLSTKVSPRTMPKP